MVAILFSCALIRGSSPLVYIQGPELSTIVPPCTSVKRPLSDLVQEGTAVDTYSAIPRAPPPGEASTVPVSITDHACHQTV